MKWMLLLTLLAQASAWAIELDGRADEAEWKDASHFADFRVVNPTTREQPPYQTVLSVLPLPDALYVSMRMEHPHAARVRGRSPRDAETLDADVIQILLDFEGQGRSAYEFAVTLSGSVRDSVVLNQTEFVRDWDAVWYAAVAEDNQGWSAEVQIPWSIAPGNGAAGEQRTIGIWAGRYSKQNGQRYAFPAEDVTDATFVRDFHRLTIPNYSGKALDLYPYASVTGDLLESSTQGDVGMDVFWSPSANHRVSATINPDFGQVESDELVVNFTAIETFFSEKRPFFTAGQQLFDVRTTQEGRLVHTRRIGGAPDAGPEAMTEIMGAFKYTGAAGPQEFGIFGAVEDDSVIADGRSYAVGRWLYKWPRVNAGYLFTYTDRPTLDRESQVHAVDFDWRLGPGFTLRGQGIGSWIDDPTLDDDDSHGAGGWLDLQYDRGTGWRQFVKATYFNRDLDFNDLGYQERAGLIDLESYTGLDKFEHPQGSRLATSAWDLWWAVQRNDSGLRLRGFAALTRFLKWLDGAETYLTYRLTPAGYDDLLTQGHGAVRLPSWSRVRWIQVSSQGNPLRLNTELHVYEEGVSGIAEEAELEAKWIVAENLSLSFQVNLIHSDDWLAWRNEAGLASYQREQLYTLMGVDWYPSHRQEIRLRLQWIGLSAEANNTYLVGPAGELLRDTRPGSDFSVSSLGLQLRYRYEFKPLSELFIVYSRGGDGSFGGTDSAFSDQLSRSWHEETAHQVLMKVRYRF